MYINLLDALEAEGLTSDHVKDWLGKNGWVHASRSEDWSYWRNGDTYVCFCDDLRKCNLGFLLDIAKTHRLHPQVMLGLMNPRMQPGWPSDKELQNHKFWLAKSTFQPPIMCQYMESGGGVFVRAEDSAQDVVYKKDCEGWSFWPCDPYGNKTPRGAVS